MAITDSAQAVFAPAVGSGPGLIMDKVVSGIFVGTVIVGDGGDGGGLTERGYQQKPSYGNTIKSSLIQDNSF